MSCFSLRAFSSDHSPSDFAFRLLPTTGESDIGPARQFFFCRGHFAVQRHDRLELLRFRPSGAVILCRVGPAKRRRTTINAAKRWAGTRNARLSHPTKSFFSQLQSARQEPPQRKSVNRSHTDFVPFVIFVVRKHRTGEHEVETFRRGDAAEP